MIDSQTLLAGGMPLVLKNKRRGEGGSFQAYSLGGCPIDIQGTERSGLIRKGCVHHDRERDLSEEYPIQAFPNLCI